MIKVPKTDKNLVEFEMTLEELIAYSHLVVQEYPDAPGLLVRRPIGGWEGKEFSTSFTPMDSSIIDKVSHYTIYILSGPELEQWFKRGFHIFYKSRSGNTSITIEVGIYMGKIRGKGISTRNGIFDLDKILNGRFTYTSI